MVSNYRGRKLSAEPIRELTRCEVFVFGSNLEGKHRGGAAGYACRHFGATYGQGVGPQGQCYAIPTMFETVGEMVPYVQEFIEYVKDHPMNRFLITRLGCGVAGFKDQQVAPLFYELRDVNNAVFALEWWLIFFDIDMRLGRQEEESPELNYGIDEEELVPLSRMYRYEIGAALNNSYPHIKIRYVDGDGKFGYTSFGFGFFFHSPWEFYVCSKDEKYKDQHADYIFYDEFHDECPNKGYVRRVHFAGVRTPFKDKRGDYIYTGDIVRAYFHGTSYVLPVGVIHEEYALLLDNHCIRMSECSKFDRLGTVFYGLDADFNDDKLVRNRNGQFFSSVYGAFACPPTSTLGKELVKARLTPNFFTDNIPYIVLNELGVEYNWRH